mmetsp:Transcript_100037/g.288872  ORF Transcript_100037/g.288872 Transcript_100037/m.288872 type:complete len:249 (-) Transcript_100037:1045-1791(-)
MGGTLCPNVTTEVQRRRRGEESLDDLRQLGARRIRRHHQLERCGEVLSDLQRCSCPGGRQHLQDPRLCGIVQRAEVVVVQGGDDVSPIVAADAPNQLHPDGLACGDFARVCFPTVRARETRVALASAIRLVARPSVVTIVGAPSQFALHPEERFVAIASVRLGVAHTTIATFGAHPCCATGAPECLDTIATPTGDVAHAVAVTRRIAGATDLARIAREAVAARTCAGEPVALAIRFASLCTVPGHVAD